MSDANGSASSAEQTIPKARLDEVIAERNRAAQESQFLRQTLDQVMANQRAQQAPRAPEQDSPGMQRLKEENPEAYAELMKSRKEAKELRAGFSGLADQTDRLLFLQHAGEAGKKRIAEVEQILNQQRQQGNFKADRAGIYTWLLGQERLRSENQPPQAAPQANTEAPPSNPANVSTIAAGTASVKKVEKSREERIAELQNVEF